MGQFKVKQENVEVNGETVLSIANGMGRMRSLGLKILEQNGISNPEAGKWYPQENWLAAFQQISEKVGEATLLLIGKSIPENAQFPPDIDSLEKALSSIDIAYHLNHRLKGKIMFNTETGEMSEGIGHYHYKKLEGNKAEIVCDNPYPCNFDLGIITAMAKNFKPKDALSVKVKHNSTSCRKNGDNDCSYLIAW